MKFREKYISNKSFLNQELKNKQVSSQIALLGQESPALLSSCPLPTGTQDHDQRQTKESALVVEEHNAEFEAMFKGLDNSKKWFLSTGKCVDNELFIFGMECRGDHPSRSLIMDPYDENYSLYGIFTREELEEIKRHNHKPLPSAST